MGFSIHLTEYQSNKEQRSRASALMHYVLLLTYLPVFLGECTCTCWRMSHSPRRLVAVGISVTSLLILIPQP